MPYTLAEAAFFGYPKEVKDLLKKPGAKAKVNVFDAHLRHCPLYAAVGDITRELGQYEITILLLELGADPLFLEYDGSIEQMSSPFIACVRYSNLGLARLMLWYAPDYETLKFRGRYQEFTGLGYVEVHDLIECEEKLRLGFADCIKDTAKDARRVKALKTSVEGLLSEVQIDEANEHYGLAVQKYMRMAKAFEEIATIYQKQVKLEGDEDEYGHLSEGALVYYNDDKRSAHSREYRPILRAYYEGKREKYLEQLYDWYQIMDGYLSGTGVVRDASVTACHAEILDRLVALSRSFKKSAMVAVYLTKASQVRTGTAIIAEEADRAWRVAQLLLEPKVVVEEAGPRGLSEWVSVAGAWLFGAAKTGKVDSAEVSEPVNLSGVRVGLAGASKEDDETPLIGKGSPTSPARGGAGDVVVGAKESGSGFAAPFADRSTLRHRHPPSAEGKSWSFRSEVDYVKPK